MQKNNNKETEQCTLHSVMCSCDGCGKEFEYKKVKKKKYEIVLNLPKFGEYVVCDDCKKKGLQFE